MPHDPPTLQASTVFWQLAIVLALVLLNGFFVASEFALVSVRKTRIDQLAAEGSSAAKVVQRAVGDLDRYIAATQVGITIASLMLGGIGHGVLEPLFELLFHKLHLPPSLLGVTSASISLFLAYFIMTALHVVIGELMPKTIALQKPDTISMLVARPLVLFAKVASPLIWTLNGTGNFLLRLIGFRSAEGHGQVHSPQELDLLFTQSHEGGEISETEREILHRVVKFSDLTAREVMVPRVEMKGIPLEMARRDLIALVEGKPHTRMPVYTDSLDDVVGIVHLKDLVQAASALRRAALTTVEETAQMEPGIAAEWLHSVLEGNEDTVSLSPFVREVARVPETITIDKMLVEFKRRRQQMAIVIDEYGGTAGLLTMGDLLEQVFGDVHDEFDAPEAAAIENGDGRVHLPGRTLIDEINERYGCGFRSEDSDTVAGLILDVLNRPADVGDEVEINGVSLRVEAVERLRITAVSLAFSEPKKHNAHNE